VDKRQRFNLFAVRPIRNLSWTTEADGKIVLIVPKFKSRFLVRWLVPLLARPNFHVKLDGYGSYVWEQCDGNSTVEEIVSSMAGSFRESPDSLDGRVAAFVQRLIRDEFLIVGNGAGTNTVS